ncbi:hypothetical protein FHS55_004512 [Angulomicrobium tetraedrale]|uniref:Uncharacterized protein n=1 Tax=Ancylobacter tetraedralis TaxID=217068 RepID=A0A839ZH15_9HYPH|nr:hypothetical protein [Ancylobacter tetraedralis]MBB3773867.1 hypothetical protein [Ancylobacter tetraedralis]
MLTRRHLLSASLAVPVAAVVHRAAIAADTAPVVPGAASVQGTGADTAPHCERAEKRVEILRRFRKMYVDRHFGLDLFAADTGYLKTTLADANRMSLRFFVEYNNVWWFAIIDGVEVPSIGYDAETDTGSIVLDIRYGNEHLLAMQHIGFQGDRISRLQTYASNSFFGKDTPLVRLDAYGNAIWLETGYDLKISAEAAEVFLRTPTGRFFSENEPTSSAIVRIKNNLADLRKRYGWQPI